MRPKAVALVLVGAVTRGAFEAGVIKVLTERGIAVRQIVAASSGALNGTALAAGIRSRCEVDAANRLVNLWLKSADACSVLDFRLIAFLRGRGLSGQKKLLGLLRRTIPPCRSVHPPPVSLHILVAPLQGVEAMVGRWPATTYVNVLDFQGEHFDTCRGLEKVFTAATASAAFPGLFTPVDVEGLGPCIDGGLIDGTPLRDAYAAIIGRTVDAVIVVAPTPTHTAGQRAGYAGLALFEHLFDMFFTERAYQGIREVHWVNSALRGIEELAEREGWGAEQIDDIKAAIGLRDREAIQLVTIRPLTRLPGGIFAGFTSAAIRRSYVETGMARAHAVLDQLGW